MKFPHLPLALVLLSFLAASLPVEAQPGPGGGGRFARERPGNIERRVPPRREVADVPRKADDRAGDRERRLAPRREATESTRRGDERGSEEDRRRRLSPEERSKLRRDIQDAGRDIYRPEQPSRRFPRREP